LGQILKKVVACSCTNLHGIELLSIWYKKLILAQESMSDVQVS